MLLQNVIISFPTIFTPKVAKGATEAKFSSTFLIAPDHPQLGLLQAEFDAAVANGFPSGLQSSNDVCFAPYDVKYAGKDYHDPRFSGWFAVSTSAKVDDRPSVVGLDMQPIIDPSAVYSGMLVHANFNISAYTKGKGGIGGWLNGIMSTGEVGPMGRLDSKPSTEQMIAGLGTTPPTQTAPTTPAPAAPNAAPVAPAPVAPAGPTYVMTEAAAGNTREQLLANGQGWTDELLLSQGMMIASSV